VVNGQRTGFEEFVRKRDLAEGGAQPRAQDGRPHRLTQTADKRRVPNGSAAEGPSDSQGLDVFSRPNIRP
jgi:hypothetical protein